MRRTTIPLPAGPGFAAAATALAEPPHRPPGPARKGWRGIDGGRSLHPGLSDRGGRRVSGLRRPREGERWVTLDGQASLNFDEAPEAPGAVDRRLRN